MRRKTTLGPIALAVLAASGTGWLLVRLLERAGLYLRPGPLNSKRAAELLLFLFLAALFFLADAALLRRTKGGVRRAAGLAALAAEGLLFLWLAFWAAFGDCAPRYVPLRSPDGAREVIVEEESWLLGGWGCFYAPAGPGLMRKLDAGYDTDDGFRPFSAGAYALTWEEERLLVRYDFGAGGPWHTCEVPLP